MDIDVPSTNCEICGDQEEDISHLFFRSDLAVWLWSRLGLWVKSSIPTLNSIIDCFAWIDKTFQVPSKVKTVKAIVVALFKSIWIYRNDIIFNNNRMMNAKDISVNHSSSIATRPKITSIRTSHLYSQNQSHGTIARDTPAVKRNIGMTKSAKCRPFHGA
ncbi:hypothetical protein LXL04_015085 [Taraxacum kok-saghyz]